MTTALQALIRTFNRCDRSAFSFHGWYVDAASHREIIAELRADAVKNNCQMVWFSPGVPCVWGMPVMVWRPQPLWSDDEVHQVADALKAEFRTLSAEWFVDDKTNDGPCDMTPWCLLAQAAMKAIRKT